MAAGDGIDMRFDLTRGGNTFDGHRLLWLAAEHGLQTELKERLKVLERITVERENSLAKEIEDLRDR